MKEAALFCDGTASYVNPAEPVENELVTLRFRTAKDDVERVRLMTGVGGYDMEKEKTEGEFDFYRINWRLNEEPFRYCFEIQSNDEKCYYSRCGVSKEIVEFYDFVMKDMHIVQEMYARGFEFEPLDIYRAQATKFLIVDGKLMPPLSSIDGMGEKAAEAVAEASKDGKYLSLDDFRQRTKASKSVIDYMVELGILSDLPASNQLSLFDF